MIHQHVFVQLIGAENICSNIQHALDRAKQIVGDIEEQTVEETEPLASLP
jgi:hypothetical protein